MVILLCLLFYFYFLQQITSFHWANGMNQFTSEMKFILLMKWIVSVSEWKWVIAFAISQQFTSLIPFRYLNCFLFFPFFREVKRKGTKELRKKWMRYLLSEINTFHPFNWENETKEWSGIRSLNEMGYNFRYVFSTSFYNSFIYFIILLHSLPIHFGSNSNN